VKRFWFNVHFKPEVPTVGASDLGAATTAWGRLTYYGRNRPACQVVDIPSTKPAIRLHNICLAQLHSEYMAGKTRDRKRRRVGYI